MSQATDRLLARLAADLGDDVIVLDATERELFAQDALGRRGDAAEAALPIAIVRPADTAAVSRCLVLAAEAGVAVVPYGAGTGLMGGARSVRPGLVLDTVRLNSIAVSPRDRTVWAGGGAILANVDRDLREHGLCLGHDPWTFPVATVGGTIGTNSLGYKGGRYGGMGDEVIAIEAALTDGTVIRTRAVTRRSAGPDVRALFVGAEGQFGVVTAACLRGHAIPEAEQRFCYHFASFEDGFAAIDEMSAVGLRPALVDYGESHAAPWPELSDRRDEPPTLYLGFEGFAEEVAAFVERATRIVESHGAQLQPQKEVERFWANRHVVAERFARNRRRDRPWQRSPDLAMDYIHVALPPSQVLAFRAKCHAATADSPVALLECGLWTGPELFSAVLGAPAADGGYERVAAVIDGLLRACQDLGGSMEYVHGVGLRLRHLMAREHGAALGVLQRLKRELDPADILNPGKALEP